MNRLELQMERGRLQKLREDIFKMANSLSHTAMLEINATISEELARIEKELSKPFSERLCDEIKKK